MLYAFSFTGCKVLAFTGSFEKTLWLKRIGAGYIFDYNVVDVEATLKEYAPEGVDYYFDNVSEEKIRNDIFSQVLRLINLRILQVGGEFACKVMKYMKPKGRVALCGAISTYNKVDPDRKSAIGMGCLEFTKFTCQIKFLI